MDHVKVHNKPNSYAESYVVLFYATNNTPHSALSTLLEETNTEITRNSTVADKSRDAFVQMQ